ncbi:UNVERIFIED_CONTAM: hypothetical protein RMT77_015223 [Armadillidium vulgare]
MLTGLSTETFPAIYFQSDGIPSIESYAVCKETLPVLDRLSLCLHAFFIHIRGDKIPLLSYAVEDNPEEISIWFDFESGSVEFSCCNGRGNFVSKPIQLLDSFLTWLHICITIDLKTGKVKLYLNEVVEEIDLHNQTQTEELIEIQDNGTIVLGVEQNEILGGFSVKETFQGYFANYVLSKDLFDETVVKNFLACGLLKLQKPHLTFDNFDEEWKTHGSTNFTNVLSSSVCNVSFQDFVVFPEQMDFRRASHLCKTMKGEITTPMNEEENAQFVEITKPFLNVCSSEFNTYMWVGIKSEVINGSLQLIHNERRTPPTYTNFKSGVSTSMDDPKCVLLETHSLGKWIRLSCNIESCVTCSFPNLPNFKLRGLCSRSTIDNTYELNGYHNKKPKFQGLRGSSILWDNGTWNIINPNVMGMRGEMVISDEKEYPFGRHSWNIQGDTCHENTRDLFLTSCNKYEYTCDDGICIPEFLRCDLEEHCPDRSDEIACNTAIIPKTYTKEIPPPKWGRKPAQIDLSVTIVQLFPLDIIENYISLVILITCQWKDSRLSMESLGAHEDMNIITNGENIWVPKFIIEDQSKSQAKSELYWQTFVVIRGSEAEPDDLANISEERIYSGSKNLLKLVQSFLVRGYCKMSLYAFPLDTQRCDLVIRMKDFGNNLVEFVATNDSLSFEGPTELREYKLVNISLERDDVRNISAYRITLYLNHFSSFYVFNTYIPTLLIILICYSTFFFHIDDFGDRVMVSLTVLLVIATLFTQTTASSPTTSYLKLLDVWFFSCILINFIIIILLVSINFVRLREQEDQEINGRVFKFKKNFNINEAKSKAKIANQWALKLGPIIIGAFVIIYILVAFAFYN